MCFDIFGDYVFVYIVIAGGRKEKMKRRRRRSIEINVSYRPEQNGKRVANRKLVQRTPAVAETDNEQLYYLLSGHLIAVYYYFNFYEFFVPFSLSLSPLPIICRWFVGSGRTRFSMFPRPSRWRLTNEYLWFRYPLLFCRPPNTRFRLLSEIGLRSVQFTFFFLFLLTAVWPSHRIGNLKNSEPYTLDCYCYRV